MPPDRGRPVPRASARRRPGRARIASKLTARGDLGPSRVGRARCRGRRRRGRSRRAGRRGGRRSARSGCSAGGGSATRTPCGRGCPSAASPRSPRGTSRGRSRAARASWMSSGQRGIGAPSRPGPLSARHLPSVYCGIVVPERHEDVARVADHDDVADLGEAGQGVERQVALDEAAVRLRLEAGDARRRCRRAAGRARARPRRPAAAARAGRRAGAGCSASRWCPTCRRSRSPRRPARGR